jgi:hypothetical protein
MNFVKSLSLVPVVVFAMTSPALCQDAPAPAGPPKAYLTALGGAALNMDFKNPASVFAVEYGERVHHDVIAYANFNYVHNLMSTRMRDNLVVAGDDLTALTGVPWEFVGRDRGLAFSMGGKFLIPADMQFRPYVGGGLGILNLKRRIIERDFGDVSETFFEMTGLNDGVIDAGTTSTTKPLAEVMLGVSGATGRTYLDFAYRYRRAFNSFERIQFSQITFGVGVAF